METKLIIWWSSGDFYRIVESRNSHEMVSEYFALPQTTALEIMFHDKEDMECPLTRDFIEQNFSHCSIHTPHYAYQDDRESHRILQIIEKLCVDLPIKNIVIHPDAVLDWSIFQEYKHLPLSIENMDERKKSCQWVQDLQKIFDENPYLWFVLDLQHCFVNDPSMQLAKDLHKAFGDRLVQYHISGYHPEYLHYPLYKTQQDIIIASMERKDLPIIVESTFEAKEELSKELPYIQVHLS